MPTDLGHPNRRDRRPDRHPERHPDRRPDHRQDRSSDRPSGPSVPSGDRRSIRPHRRPAARLLVEPRRPEWLRRSPRAPLFVVATVCVGAFMGQLDASIVTVAFPTLQRTFGASVESVTWVALSYLATLIGGVVAVGRLSDMVGRKLVYTYGFVVFSVGSALCALAPSLLALNGFRVLQGLGAAMLQANSVALIYLAVPRERLGRAIGIQGASQALGLACGPALGGFLLAAGGWRLIFFVNVPVGVLGTLAGLVFLPRSRDLRHRAPSDWVGLSLFMPAVLALLTLSSFGATWGLSVTTVAVGLVLVVTATAFVLRERSSPAPMLDVTLFRRAGFSGGLASGFLAYACLFGTMLAVPFFLERQHGAGPGAVGLALSALPVAIGVAAPVAGQLMDAWGARGLTTAGMLITAGALVLLGVFQPAGWAIAAVLALAGTGLGVFIAPNNARVMASAPRTHAGSAGGVLNMTRGLGTAVGLALTGLALGAGSAGRTGATPLAAHGDAFSTGFATACLLLAGLALAAAAVTATAGSRHGHD